MQNDTTIRRCVLLSNQQKNKVVVYNNLYQKTFAKPTKQKRWTAPLTSPFVICIDGKENPVTTDVSKKNAT